MVQAGEYRIDLAFGEESCELVKKIEVACKDGYSKQGHSCSEQCKRGESVKLKEGSCEVPKLKASIQSKTLDIGYLKKQNQHLQTNTTSRSRIIQVEPSAKFGLSSITHTKHIGPGQDSWVKLTNQSGTESQSLHKFVVNFDASGIPDSTELAATLTFKGTAQDYNTQAADDDKVVADNITLQARAVTQVYEHADIHVYLWTGSCGLHTIPHQIQDGA